MPQHRLSAINVIHRVATCSVCGPNIPLKSNGHGSYRCKVAYKQQPCNQVVRKKKGATKMREDILAAQGGVCALCKRDSARWCLDHDHVNGLARGVLCYSCNVGLGQFGDDPDRLIQAVDYLDLWSRKHETEDHPVWLSM